MKKLEGTKVPTFKVKGGLGKHIVFSSLLKAINKKYGIINIISPYPEVFTGNSGIQYNIFLDDYENNNKYYGQVISKIYSYDPYDHEFTFDDKHILDSWIEAFGLNPKLVNTPIVKVPKDIIQSTDEFIEKETTGKLILVQFSGGQTPLGYDDTKVYQRTDMTVKRNYPFQMAQILVNKLKKEYPEHTIINVSLPNEYNLVGTKRIPMNFRAHFETVKKADVVICIDSMLQHISATSDTPTIVLWNSKSFTPSHKFGWKKHINIQEPDMIIDYDDVLDEVKKLNI